MLKKMFFLLIAITLLHTGASKAKEFANDTLWNKFVKGTISDIMFSPDDQYLVVIGYGTNDYNPKYPRFFDAYTGELLFEIKEAKNSYFGSFSQDGKMFFCQDRDSLGLVVYDMDNKIVKKRIPKGYGSWGTGIFVNDNKTAWASMSYSKFPFMDTGEINVFDTETWEVIHVIEGFPTNLIKSSPSGHYVAFRSKSGNSIYLWNTTTFKHVRSFNMPERIEDFAFSPDGKLIAGTVEYTNRIYVWDVGTGNRIYEISYEDADSYGGILFSIDSKYLVVAFKYNDIFEGGTRVINLNNISIVHEYPIPIKNMSISNDSKYLAMGKMGNVVVYHAKWGETGIEDLPENEDVIFPNPTDGIVQILFDMPNEMKVKISIYDSFGKEIEQLHNGIGTKGMVLLWDSTQFPSGVYYCRIESKSYQKAYKIIVKK